MSPELYNFLNSEFEVKNKEPGIICFKNSGARFVRPRSRESGTTVMLIFSTSVLKWVRGLIQAVKFPD